MEWSMNDHVKDSKKSPIYQFQLLVTRIFIMRITTTFSKLSFGTWWLSVVIYFIKVKEKYTLRKPPSTITKSFKHCNIWAFFVVVKHDPFFSIQFLHSCEIPRSHCLRHKFFDNVVSQTLNMKGIFSNNSKNMPCF